MILCSTDPSWNDRRYETHEREHEPSRMEELPQVSRYGVTALTYSPLSFRAAPNPTRDHPSITPLTIAISLAFVLIHYANIATLVPTTAFPFTTCSPAYSLIRFFSPSASLTFKPPPRTCTSTSSLQLLSDKSQVTKEKGAELLLAQQPIHGIISALPLREQFGPRRPRHHPARPNQRPRRRELDPRLGRA